MEKDDPNIWNYQRNSHNVQPIKSTFTGHLFILLISGTFFTLFLLHFRPCVLFPKDVHQDPENCVHTSIHGLVAL